MDQIEDVCADLQPVKNENAIVVKLKDGLKEQRISLTNTVGFTNSAQTKQCSGRHFAKRMAHFATNSSQSFDGIDAENGSKSHKNLWRESRSDAERGRSTEFCDSLHEQNIFRGLGWSLTASGYCTAPIGFTYPISHLVCLLRVFLPSSHLFLSLNPFLLSTLPRLLRNCSFF